MPSGLVVRRRLALVGASALLIIVAGKTGLYSFGSASATAAQAPFANVKATATPWKIADLTTPPPPTSTPDAARWMVVQHTNGLGLVLRPTGLHRARDVAAGWRAAARHRQLGRTGRPRVVAGDVA